MSVFADMRGYIAQRAIVISQSGCWEWSGQLDKDGYGQFRVDSKSKWRKVHRLAYEVFRGAIPAGMLVLHKCDNPKCCNANHLYLGTHKDNVRDMVLRGRASKGPGKRSHCARGHELSPENRLGKRGADCKICHRMRQAKYRSACHSVVRKATSPV